MPWHVAPALRAIEDAREKSGIYPVFDTLGVTEQKALEAAGTPKVVPVAFTIWYGGIVYTAH
jgi:hypothetical protein